MKIIDEQNPEPGDQSVCAECSGKMIARRGADGVVHWTHMNDHQPRPLERTCEFGAVCPMAGRPHKHPTA